MSPANPTRTGTSVMQTATGLGPKSRVSCWELLWSAATWAPLQDTGHPCCRACPVPAHPSHPWDPRSSLWLHRPCLPWVVGWWKAAGLRIMKSIYTATTMCIVGSFRWQCVLGLWGGNVCCWVFEVAMCGVGSLRWQCVLGVLGGNVWCWVF